METTTPTIATTPTDAELLRRYRRRGDRDALDRLLRRHRGLVYSVALRHVRDSHVADDVAQTVFEVFVRRGQSQVPQVPCSAEVEAVEVSDL